MNDVNQDVWKPLWSSLAPHRVKKFIWKCLKDIVPTKTKVCQFKDIDIVCSLCNQDHESLQHLLLDCSFSKSVWMDMNINLSRIQKSGTNISNWIYSWFINSNNAGIAGDESYD